MDIGKGNSAWIRGRGIVRGYMEGECVFSQGRRVVWIYREREWCGDTREGEWCGQRVRYRNGEWC